MIVRMTTTENKRLLKHIYLEISKGNLEPLMTSMAEEITWTIIGSTPISGVFHGRQEVLEGIVRPLGAALEGHVDFTFERFIAEDEHVVMLARGRGTAKSGQPYDNTYCIVSRISNGKIHEMTDYVDTELIRSALFGS
jgi:ketosteroid isomerase-like protein